MPPKVKFRKDEIVRAALDIARSRGLEGVTAREVAAALGVSTRPIFTYYAAMDELRRDVCRMAKERYREYVRNGLAEPIPLYGVGRQFIRFAREEPELYKLLFLTRPEGAAGGAMEALADTRDLVLGSVMGIYRMDAPTAERYIRDLWLMAFSFATLVVTDNCPYTDEEMGAILAEVSLSLCKAYKEILGLPEGKYDKDAVFRELVRN